MPGAGRIRGAIDGGPLKGGAPRAVWQVLGADPRTVSARSAAQRLAQLGRACHLVWNPIHGEVVQLIPIMRAARSLGWPDGPNQLAPVRPHAGTLVGPMQRGAAASAAGGSTGDVIAEVNAEGRVCLQICVVAFAWDPFTLLPMRGHHQILDWLDCWDVPRQWPAAAGPVPARPLHLPGPAAVGQGRPFRRLAGTRPDRHRARRAGRGTADRAPRPGPGADGPDTGRARGRGGARRLRDPGARRLLRRRRDQGGSTEPSQMIMPNRPPGTVGQHERRSPPVDDRANQAAPAP